MSPNGSITLGIVVGIISTIVQSIGLSLQRKSHILEAEKDRAFVRPSYRRGLWQTGFGMFLTANIVGSSIQISTLPLPLLAALQASGLVFNTICATLILDEPFTCWSLSGTILVCAGAILIGIFGAIPAPTHTLPELLELLVHRSFVVWIAATMVVVCAVAITTEMLQLLVRRRARRQWGPHSEQFTNELDTHKSRTLRGLSFGFVSGVLSAHCLLVAKSAVELLIQTFVNKQNQFGHWQSWMLLLGVVVLALTQLYYNNRGLEIISTTTLYPFVFWVYNIIAILDGLIYFQQTNLIRPYQAGLIAVGTIVLLSGVVALSGRVVEEQHQPAVGQGVLAPGIGLAGGEDDSLNGEGNDYFGHTEYHDDDNDDIERRAGMSLLGPGAPTGDENSLVGGEAQPLLGQGQQKQTQNHYRTFSSSSQQLQQRYPLSSLNPQSGSPANVARASGNLQWRERREISHGTT